MTFPHAPLPPSPVTIADIRAAADRLRGASHRTPTVRSRTLDALVGAKVECKCENFQRVGAFKFRGAYNALAKLKDSEPAAASRGVLAFSSGNHAQAVALAGSLLDVPTVIVMPQDAPAVKLEATRGYLGRASEVVLYDRRTTDREELGRRLASERGLGIIPPYDHPDIIAGQGTAAMEFHEEIASRSDPGLDVLFIPCGGGGLLSGCAVATRSLAPACRIIGVEPEAGDDATRSFYSGTLQSVHNPPTIADGARTPSLGRWTFPLVLAHVDAMMTVSDGELVEAMRFFWERMKLVVEPTGALGLAGLMKLVRGGRALLRDGSPIEVRAKHVGVMISGGNVDPREAAKFLSCKQPVG